MHFLYVELLLEGVLEAPADFKVTIIPPAIAGQLAYHAAAGTDAASLVHLGRNLHVVLD